MSSKGVPAGYWSLSSVRRLQLVQVYTDCFGLDPLPPPLSGTSPGLKVLLQEERMCAPWRAGRRCRTARLKDGVHIYSFTFRLTGLVVVFSLVHDRNVLMGVSGGGLPRLFCTQFV